MAGNSLSLTLFIITFILLHVANGTRVNNTVPSISQGGVVYLNTSVAGVFRTWSTSVDGSISACSLAPSDIADSYFVMSYISTSPAKEITIDVKYVLRCCTNDKVFKYSIGLYVLRAMGYASTNPSPMTQPYTYVGELRNTSLMIGLTRIYFTSQMRVDMENLTGLYIAFRDTGICGDVLSLSWHYYKCPRYAGEHMEFPVTNAPTTRMEVTRVNGYCVANSQPKTNAGDNYMFCFANGTAKVKGGCECKAGFENTSLSECNHCGPRTFKTVSGNFPCMKCGANVVDGKLPRTSVCQCKPGFYRPKTKENDHNVNCEEPPTAPRNVNATYIASTWARLEWIQPAKRGTGDIPKYTVAFDGRLYTTGNLYFNLTGLDTFKDYTVTVSSINNVTAAIDMTSHTTFSFKTISGLPSVIQNLKLKRNDDGSVTVFWEKPASVGGSDLRYFVVVNGDKGQFMVKQNYTVLQSTETTKYTISIKSHTSSGFSDQRTISFEIQGKGKDYDSLIAGLISTICVLAAIGLLLCFCMWRKKTGENEDRPVDFELAPVSLQERKKGSKTFDNKTYIEQIRGGRVNFNYDGNDEELHIPKEYVQTGAVLHKGKINDIRLGILQIPNNVVVKIFEKNTFNMDLAKKLKEWNHQNIISFKGIVLRDAFVEAVFEFASNGRLDTYLQTKRKELSTLNLLETAQGVADGMTYLSRKGFIHKFLKAENILVSRDNICKIYGFNLDQQEKEGNYFWTSPEALRGLALTSKSDVWSYGVLLWEILSYGKKPDAKQVNQEQNVSGLQRPENCSEAIYELMKKCLEYDVGQRPTFTRINQRLIEEIDLRRRDRTGVYESIP